MPRHGNPKFNEITTNPNGDLLMGTGENTKNLSVLAESLKIAEEVDRKDPNSVWQGFVKYVEICGAHDVRIGILSACLALGIPYNTMNETSNGKYGDKDMQAVYRKIKQVCSAYREMAMQDIKHPIHPAVGIWWQKNLDGFSDNPIPARDLLEDGETEEDVQAIKERYADLLD